MEVLTSMLFYIFIFSANSVYASDYDEELVDTLKIEANHNVERLKSYKSEVSNNKIYENEREKGLGEFLEEQEKWDLIRERGLREYRKQKRSESLDESSDEYKQDLKEKEKVQSLYEKSRRTHVKTRNKIRVQQPKNISQLETEELQLSVDRPRYEIRKRRENKWIAIDKSVQRPSSPGFQTSMPAPTNDFPPAPEFPTAPVPYEGFEDLPPPAVYDSNMNSGVPYDPTFGGEMSIPPPPPPPPDYDF